MESNQLAQTIACSLSLLSCRRAGPTRTRAVSACPAAWVVCYIYIYPLQTPTP